MQAAAFVAHPQKPSKYREVPQLFHEQGQIFPKNKFRFKFTLKCDNFVISLKYKLTVEMVSTFQI